MTQNPQDSTTRMRAAGRFGPEVVAALLSVLVLVVAGTVAVLGPGTQAVTGPSATPPPAASPDPSAATPSHTPNARAAILLAGVDRLLERRGELAAALDDPRTSAVVFAELIRGVNAALVQQDVPLTQLAADPVTADLAGRIRAVNDAAFDAVHRAQRASIRDVARYRAGAIEVVASLAPVDALRTELATHVGATAPAGRLAPDPTIAPVGPAP